VADSKRASTPRKQGERKRPDVSFNFGANAKPKKGGKGSSYFRARYAGGGS
jgi:hypothetical protein